MDVRKASQQLFPMQHALTALGPLSRQACRNIAQTAGGCPNFKPESPIQSCMSRGKPTLYCRHQANEMQIDQECPKLKQGGAGAA
eukprot:scaffold205489_cov15-Tisochrysis_lutea.AAC.1